MKIVINKCYGGFGLSPEAIYMYASLKKVSVFPYTEDNSDTRLPYGDRNLKRWTEDSTRSTIYWLTEDIGDKPTLEQLNKASWMHDMDIERHDPLLVKVVEKLGEKANSRFSELKIVEVPDGVDYEIEEYDGMEWIAEAHRTWS